MLSLYAKFTSGLICGLLLAWGISSCAPAGAPYAEAEYPARILGTWHGRTADEDETIQFESDGKFVSEVRRAGFISNTLGQGTTRTIRGTWTIAGKIVTMTLDSAVHAYVSDHVTTSTIEQLKPNQLVVKSDQGNVATFLRFD
jgi:uncharacterized protein (TIGR03066 family)